MTYVVLVPAAETSIIPLSPAAWRIIAGQNMHYGAISQRTMFYKHYEPFIMQGTLPNDPVSSVYSLINKVVCRPYM